jgi:hypothetical protein
MAIVAFGVVSRPAAAPTISLGAIAKKAGSNAAAKPIVLTAPGCRCHAPNSSRKAGTAQTGETLPRDGGPSIEAGPVDGPYAAGLDAEPVSTDPLPLLPPGWRPTTGTDGSESWMTGSEPAGLGGEDEDPTGSPPSPIDRVCVAEAMVRVALLLTGLRIFPAACVTGVMACVAALVTGVTTLPLA